MLSYKFLSLPIKYMNYFKTFRFSSTFSTTFSLIKDNSAIKKFNEQQKSKNNYNNKQSLFKFPKLRKIEMHESHSTKPFIVKTPAYIVSYTNTKE